MLLHRGTSTFSVSSDKASLDSFSFRLSLEDRFHRTPADITGFYSAVSITEVFKPYVQCIKINQNHQEYVSGL